MGGRGASSTSGAQASQVKSVIAVGYDMSTGDGDPSMGFVNDAEFEKAVNQHWSIESQTARHPSTDDERAYSQALDAEFDKGSFEGTIYRGVGMEMTKIAKLHRGSLIDMGGPASWSKNKSVADGFADSNSQDYGGEPVVFILRGTKHGRDISSISSLKFEQEVATSSKSKMRVADKLRKNGTTYIWLDEVERMEQ